MIVVNYFRDKTDKTEYFPGDIYPREGVSPTEERIADLSKRGYIFAEEPKETKKPAKKAAPKKKKE